MPDAKDPERVRLGRLGGLTGSANTADWHARMDHVRANSPADDRRWAKDLGFGADPARWTAEQRRRIATAKKKYYAELRHASVKALKRQKADRLRRRAAALDAEAGES